MPIHNLNAIPPFVQIGLSVGLTYRRQNLGFPPIPRNALIDTGASLTAITPTVVAALAPQRVGRRQYTRPGQSPISPPIYSFLLCFEPAIGDPDWVAESHWFSVVAVEATIATPGVNVLIGQDVLASLALSWDGPRSRLLLMY
jgi:hypothetical protein